MQDEAFRRMEDGRNNIFFKTEVFPMWDFIVNIPELLLLTMDIKNHVYQEGMETGKQK